MAEKRFTLKTSKGSWNLFIPKLFKKYNIQEKTS